MLFKKRSESSLINCTELILKNYKLFGLNFCLVLCRLRGQLHAGHLGARCRTRTCVCAAFRSVDVALLRVIVCLRGTSTVYR